MGASRVGSDGRLCLKFQELVLRLHDDHSTAPPEGNDEADGLALMHDRLVNAAAEIKATTTSSRNKIKFCVPDEIRLMASDAAQMSRSGVKKTLAENCPESPT